MKAKRLFFAAGIFVLIFSCTKDFIAAKLSNLTVTLLAPADNYHSSSVAITFWWDELKGADKYELQIVKPNFSSVQQLVLDTNVTGTKFSYSLLPGIYQWRVRAKNNASSTDYTTRSLAVDSVQNLSSQSLILVAPANNLYTKLLKNTFKWDSLSAAVDYRFQILNQSSTAIVDIVLHTDTFSYSLNEGIYTWQVRGQNATSNTLYTSRVLTIDTTAPPVSVISAPLSGDSAANPVALAWTRNASASEDSLFIYPDSLISAAVYKGSFTATAYSFTGISGKKYFWRFKSGDLAGNWSKFGILSKFYVK